MTDKNHLPFLLAEKTIVTSHYHLSAGTGDQKLNDAMTDLLESGEIIHDIYWHPYRPPLYQDNVAVISKSKIFKEAYQDMVSKLDKNHAEFWNTDFFPILDLLDFAVENNLSLLTFLEKPFDKERADKVFYPIDLRSDPTIQH